MRTARRARSVDAESELTCRRCGSLTRTVRNPFFGIGLAVHPQLRLCRRCDWVMIVPGLPDHIPADGADTATPRKLFSRMHKVWTRRNHGA